MKLFLKDDHKTVYIKEKHWRTVLWENRTQSYVLIPRCFMIFSQNLFFFGYLSDENLCYRIGTNYYFYRNFIEDNNHAFRFQICLGRTDFLDFQECLDYFWNSTFYNDFPLVYGEDQSIKTPFKKLLEDIDKINEKTLAG